jgi:hypothetical protein
VVIQGKKRTGRLAGMESVAGVKIGSLVLGKANNGASAN